MVVAERNYAGKGVNWRGENRYRTFNFGHFFNQRPSEQARGMLTCSDSLDVFKVFHHLIKPAILLMKFIHA